MKMTYLKQFYLIILKCVFSQATGNMISTTGSQHLSGIFAKARIVKGYPCSTDTYPFVVRITYTRENSTRFSSLCGGTLISPYWILTAAHCIVGDGEFTVTAALNSREGKSFVLHVEDTIIHPEFDSYLFRGDIALIRLNSSVQRSKHIDFVELPKKKHTNSAPPCSTGIIMGWGTTGSNQFTSGKQLRCAKVPVIKTSDCSSIFAKEYGIQIWPDQICAVSSQGVDACQGDSGGPLLCDSVQIGIVSWGIQCGIPNSPGVYTRTDYYLDFIKQHVSGLSGCHSTRRICVCLIISHFLFLIVIST